MSLTFRDIVGTEPCIFQPEPTSDEGEMIGPAGIVHLPAKTDLPVNPELSSTADSFAAALNATGRKRIILEVITGADLFGRLLRGV